MLAHQPVGVVVEAALPRAVRVTEVHRNARAFAQLLVHRHLPTLDVRHALAHRLRNPQELVREVLHHVGHAFDEVTFPVPRKPPVFDLGWSHMDAHRVRVICARRS